MQGQFVVYPRAMVSQEGVGDVGTGSEGDQDRSTYDLSQLFIQLTRSHVTQDGLIVLDQQTECAFKLFIQNFEDICAREGGKPRFAGACALRRIFLYEPRL